MGKRVYTRTEGTENVKVSLPQSEGPRTSFTLVSIKDLLRFESYSELRKNFLHFHIYLITSLVSLHLFSSMVV